MQNAPDLATIRGFVAVARRLSFRVAADELAMDATVLSRKIARLEARLGVRLLQRTTRKVALTEAGAVYFQRCDDLLSRMADAEAEVSGYASGPTGTLRLGLPNVFGQRHIAPLVPEFMARYPELRIELSFNDRMVDLVDLQLDAAVRIGTLDAVGDMRVRKLAPNHRLICASPTYFEHHPPPQQPADLSEHRLLHFSPSLEGHTWRLRRGRHEIEIPIDPVLTADNVEALRLATLAGQGITILAMFVAAADLTAGRLVPVLAEWRPPETTISLVYPNAPFTPQKVHALSTFLADKFSGHPPWEHAGEIAGR